MNPLAIGLGLGIANGGVNYLADNMWDKQIKSLTKDQQEISRFSSDLNTAKQSALNTVLGLYPDLESARKDPTIPILSSIGNKAGPTKYKSDFASSLISGISDSLKQANHYGLFKLKKKDQPTTVKITPEVTKSTPPQSNLIEMNYWSQSNTPYGEFLRNNKDFTSKAFPTFSARDYILDSHQNKIT